MPITWPHMHIDTGTHTGTGTGLVRQLLHTRIGTQMCALGVDHIHGTRRRASHCCLLGVHHMHRLASSPLVCGRLNTQVRLSTPTFACPRCKHLHSPLPVRLGMQLASLTSKHHSTAKPLTVLHVNLLQPLADNHFIAPNNNLHFQQIKLTFLTILNTNFFYQPLG